MEGEGLQRVGGLEMLGEALKKWAGGWRLRGWMENKNLVGAGRRTGKVHLAVPGLQLQQTPLSE